MMLHMLYQKLADKNIYDALFQRSCQKNYKNDGNINE